MIRSDSTSLLVQKTISQNVTYVSKVLTDDIFYFSGSPQ